MQFISLNDYVHILFPEQLAQYLKAIYDKFEKGTKEFYAVSMLKMNIEQFVACCGLFSLIRDLKSQENQAVSFACSMIKRIDSINEELNIELRLKIGIKNGEPVVGRMLSPNKPSFEILGEFISLAQKIEHEGEIGAVNVSENLTYFSVASKSF